LSRPIRWTAHPWWIPICRSEPLSAFITIHDGRWRNTIVAALYITYGPLITMVYSAGKGTHEFVLNREGEYVLSQENIRLKKRVIFIVWVVCEGLDSVASPVCEYLEAEGYTLRYSGGFVPDINQLLIRTAGFYLSRPEENPNGKLRLLFELQPMAFLMEQAGGSATDGKKNILDIPVDDIGQRSPSISAAILSGKSQSILEKA